MKELVTSDMEKGSSNILDESSMRDDPAMREETDEGVPTSNESQKDASLRESLRAIFSWRNYSVYLITAWVYNGFAVIYSYFTIYLREIGWEFIVIGGAMTAVAGLGALSRFVGGYVGDITNRKNLAVIAMFMMATYHLIIGITTDFIFIVGALAIYSSFGLVQGGSSAFIMDNIPREHSGLALSLFRMGASFGILTLLVFGALEPVMHFDASVRLIYLVSGIFLVFCAFGRMFFLETGIANGRKQEKSLWRDFLSENMRAVRLIKASMPAVLAIVVLDGLSDSIFKFGALLYTYEFLAFEIVGINVMLLTPLVISLPLLFRVGRMSDIMGLRRTVLLVYLVMPICAALLMVAPTYEYWMPLQVVNTADSFLPGLRLVFTTPFLAMVLKYTNDILWGLVLLTMIQKKMPRTDTSKVLAVFWSTVNIIASIGPLIGGLIFEFLEASTLFAIVLVTNLVILGGVGYYGVDKKEPETLSDRMELLELAIQEAKNDIDAFRRKRGLPT
ncbi:MAG: MFS transporter [Candidatus Thorarchaeota archaeon]